MCQLPREGLTVSRDDQHDDTHTIVAEEQPPVYDAIMIGAGISGVFILAEALQQGFKNVLVIEKHHRIGGLWAVLPEWQTVQNSSRDFCVQGFTTNKEVWNAKDVLHMLDEYVRIQDLQSHIRLNTEIFAHEWSDAEGAWTLKARSTQKSASSSSTAAPIVFKCKKLILCTGKHATPNLPAIPKDDGSVPVLHSSQVHQWGPYKGKKVVVVGSGASGLDLIINTLKTNEDAEEGKRGHQVHWVVREPKYFGTTTFKDLFLLTTFQLLFGLAGTRIVSFIINFIIHLTFRRHGLKHWLPNHDFDLKNEQLVPNRGYVARHAHRIDRRVGVEVVQVKGRQVTLSDGSTIEDVDAILMGTGYKAPVHDDNLELEKARFYMKAIPLGRYQGRLFLFGETLLDTTGSTPISVHVMSRKFWQLVKADHWEGVERRAPHLVFEMNDANVNHMDILNLLSSTSRDILPLFIWRFRMLAVHCYYRYRYNTRVFYADRLLGLNLSLDGKQQQDNNKKTA